MPLKMNELCIHSVFVALEEKVSQTKQNQVCFGWFFSLQESNSSVYWEVNKTRNGPVYPEL